MRTVPVFVALALSVVACDAEPEKKEAPQAAKDKAPAEKAKPAEKAPEPEPDKDPWQEKLEGRVLAQSGLGIGGRLSAFDIVNCESGEQYCQVCRFGGSPKIMAVGTIGDEAFKEDLRNLDAIAQKYGPDKIKAFAVITGLEGGKAVTADPAALQKQAKELRAELGISMPIVVPAKEGEEGNKVWDEYYNITASRTVMFADGGNKVQFSAVGNDDWSTLNDAIKKVVES